MEAVDLTPASIQVEDEFFAASFTLQERYVWAALTSRSDQQKQVSLAHVITVAWARNPCDLLNSFYSGDFLQTGGFNTIEYDGHMVNLNEDGEEFRVSVAFFRELVWQFVAAHANRVGLNYYPWLGDLCPEARSELRRRASAS